MKSAFTASTEAAAEGYIEIEKVPVPELRFQRPSLESLIQLGFQ